MKETTVAVGDNKIASQSEGASSFEVAFRQLSRPREHGERLNELDHQAATLVLDAFWPKFGTPRPLPDRWR